MALPDAARDCQRLPDDALVYPHLRPVPARLYRINENRDEAPDWTMTAPALEHPRNFEKDLQGLQHLTVLEGILPSARRFYTARPMSTRRSKRIAPADGEALQATTTRATVTITAVTKISKTEPVPSKEGASTNTSAKSNGGKRKRANNDNDEGRSRTYAPPEKYAHLNGVPDAIDNGLVLLLVGLNPGVTTATVGHAYSNKTNRFWRYLNSSGLTPDRLVPSLEDQTLPGRYSLGLTNLVSRPTNDQAELSKKEMDDSVSELEDKIRKYKPEAACIVGKGIWDSIYRARHGKKIPTKGFEYGWQEGEWLGVEEGWQGARVFVSPSTSGLVTINQEKMGGIWKVLGDWVCERRQERGIKVASGAESYLLK
ncbi:uracil-DNA glycosylase-like protein [Tirmania nivea]|nr:uracil-DNA glycosylase-like protein [Tirmania nivea]